MKLEMLNPHAIYLHDTPSKGAFAATKRAFSHGCIRTEKALHFSGLMAVMFAGATPEEFGEVVASGKTKRFEFTQPFPVNVRQDEHTPELQSPRLISYPVFCLTKTKYIIQ